MSSQHLSFLEIENCHFLLLDKPRAYIIKWLRKNEFERRFQSTLTMEQLAELFFLFPKLVFCSHS
jgi:hypothetical protein